MYAAILELRTWMGTDTRYFQGEDPGSIIWQFERIQDLDCLVRMGLEEEDKSGQKEIKKIQAFLKKYHNGKLTIRDIEGFSFNLSIGSFRCIAVAEGEKAVAELRANHPEAR